MLDSLLVVRHGKIVVEVYYAPYAAGIPHAEHSVTKAVISTLMAIASKDGLLDSPRHRVLNFFDRSKIANVDERKEAITVQSLWDMMAPVISGKVYRFARNGLNLKSLSLILTDPQPHYDVEIYATDATKSDPRFTGPIGLDGLYRKGELTDHLVNAVKGTWQDDHTFVIDRLVLGQGEPAERWTLTFDGKKLNVRPKIGERPEVSIDSEAGG